MTPKDPVTALPSATGIFFGVSVSPGDHFTSVTVQVCGAAAYLWCVR